MVRVVDDAAEKAIKLTQNIHGLISIEEEQKQYLFRCENLSLQ